MKRPEGTLCDKCHQAITEDQERRGETLHYGKTDYHADCYRSYRRDRAPRVQLEEVRIAFLIIALMWLIAAFAPPDADAQQLATDERGCVATYISTSGKFIFEPFLKIADKDSPSEDGEAEVWGFRVWNLEPADKSGKTKPVNVLESRYIPMRVFKEVPAGTSKRRIKCPDHLWGS